MIIHNINIVAKSILERTQKIITSQRRGDVVLEYCNLVIKHNYYSTLWVYYCIKTTDVNS